MNIRQTLTCINVNKNMIKSHKDLIDEKRKEFENSIQKSQQTISACEQANKEYLERKVKIKFSDFLKAIAEKWGYKESDIKVRMDTQRLSFVNHKGKVSKELLKKTLLEDIKHTFFYLICATKKECVTIPFKGEDIMNCVQADGKTFLDHLRVDLNQNISTKRVLYFDVYFDDFSQFVVEKKLKDLIEIGEDNQIQPRNKQYAGILMKIALEKEKESEGKTKESLY